LADFISRVEISLEQALILIRIACFRFTGKSKQELLWEAHFILNKRKTVAVGNELFKKSGFRELQVPELEAADIRQEIVDQIDILEFPLDSPFLLIKDQTVPGHQSQRTEAVLRERGADYRLSRHGEIYQNGQGRRDELRHLYRPGRRLDRHGTLSSCGQKISFQRQGDLPDQRQSHAGI
jgi:hypothetical protein